MFEKKIDGYNTIKVKIYPGGSFVGARVISLNFGKGEKEDRKYADLCEEFKARSVQAQSDTTETDTLSDDTLKVTYFASNYTFTVKCETVMPSIDHVKALSSLDDNQLDFIDRYYCEREDIDTFPCTCEFEGLIVKSLELEGKDIGILDQHYKTLVRIHDSYTDAHKKAVEYIVHKLVGNTYTKENDIISFESEDLELKKVLMDLSMSEYYDIEIIG